MRVLIGCSTMNEWQANPEWSRDGQDGLASISNHIRDWCQSHLIYSTVSS